MSRSIELSTSRISCFKQCRKKYFFKYIEKIEIPTTEALDTGKNYHKEIEKIIQNKEYIKSPLTEAFKKYIQPQLPEIATTEQEITMPLGYGLKLKGYIDAVTKNNEPVEHKTYGYAIDEKYIYRLNWDEQSTTYLMALTLKHKTPITKMIYTVVQKPTIRQKQSETEEEYIQRCYEWYDEMKAKIFSVVRSTQELESWQNEIVKLASEIKKCKNFYRNPSACFILQCPYESICQDYSR